MCICIYIMLLFSCSVMSHSFVTPWTLAHQAPVSMGFPRQEYWSAMPFPSPVYIVSPSKFIMFQVPLFASCTIVLIKLIKHFL